MSFLLFRKIGKIRQNLSSAAVVIGALRVKNCYMHDSSADLKISMCDILGISSTIHDGNHSQCVMHYGYPL